jgi:Protein of unknown function (DUF1592)/Protein of unknown function (DUF1588)/Protein of unknown function (DUF1595)/Protein of unknown function (DUF1585)/Protein of unknown function (DUF1587)
VFGLACVGTVGSGGSEPNRPGTPGTSGPGRPGTGTPGMGTPGPGMQPSGPPPTTPNGTPDSAGPLPLRRLTLFEYNNTLRDLLGDTTSPGKEGTLNIDVPTSVGYVNGAKISQANDARQFLDLSVTLSDAAASRLGMLLPQGCAAPAANAEEKCARDFIKGFGLRAFRRPVTTAEEADLFDLYGKQRTAPISANFGEAIRVLIAGMVQSPYFMYRWEGGDNPKFDVGGLVKLGSYEIASRLSYFFWATMPDQTLFDAAGKDELQSPDRIAEQARRMIKDAKFKDGIKDFSIQWLGVNGLDSAEKDPSFTNYVEGTGKSLMNESTAFFANLMSEQGGGKLEALFSSTSSFLDAKLAKLYGVSGVSGDDLKPANLNPQERAGVLTLGAFLAAHSDADYSHPVKRGVHFMHNVVCVDIPSPDGIDVPPLSERKPGQTTRQRYEEATSVSAVCATCHVNIHGAGFALESYDAVGQFRTMEDGKPVDASGHLPLLSGRIDYKNGVELSQKIGTTKEVRECITKQFLRYMLRRQEIAEEEGSLENLGKAFADSQFDMREMVVSLTKTRAFTHRQPQPGEGQ